MGVEPTRVFRLRRFSGPLGVAHAQPSFVLAEVVGLEPTQVDFTRDVSSVVPYHSGETSIVKVWQGRHESNVHERRFGICCIAVMLRPCE